MGDAGFQGGHVNRLECPAQGGGAGEGPLGDRELGHELKGMLVDPLADGTARTLTAHQRRRDQRQQQAPGVAFAARFAGIGHIDNGVHQHAIVNVVHQAPSSLLGRKSHGT